MSTHRIISLFGLLLSCVIGLTLLFAPVFVGADEDPVEVAAAKVNAHEIIQTALGLYTKTNYTVENWATLMSYKNGGDAEVDAAIDLAQILLAHDTATYGMAHVLTDLADAKAASRSVISTAFATYIQGNYTPENWALLVVFKDTGTTDIDAAADFSAIVSAETTAMNGMASIEIDISLARNTAHNALTQALLEFPSENYSAGNWASILGYKNSGDTDIDAGIDAGSILLAQMIAKNGMRTVRADLAFEKNAARERLTIYFNAYPESDFDPLDYADFVSQKNAGDTVISAASDTDSVIIAEANARAALMAVPSLAKKLADAKTSNRSALDVSFATYDQVNYRASNWNKLVQLKNNGVNGIETAGTVEAIQTALTQAQNGMSSVATTAVTDIDDARADLDALTESRIKGGNTDLLHVMTDLQKPLPLSGSNGSTITWTSSNTGVLTNSGLLVVRPLFENGDATITLTTIITKGNISSTKSFTLVAPALAAFKVMPDSTGSVSMSVSTPDVVITDPTQPVVISIARGVVNPTIDVSSLITGGNGVLPQMTISSYDTGNVSVSIPGSTRVTSLDASWNGILQAPKVTTVSLPIVAGETAETGTALELGFSGASLTFDKAVRVLFPNQAGKKVGYATTTGTFTEILTICSADTQDAGDAVVAAGECKIDVGADLVVWTKHFTSFATYRYVTTPIPVSIATQTSRSGTRSRQQTQTSVNVGSGRVLGASAYNFSADLYIGLRNEGVRELQDRLRSEGFYTLSVSTGYYGPITIAAVKAFQLAHDIPVTGYVGSLTRAALNI